MLFVYYCGELCVLYMMRVVECGILWVVCEFRHVGVGVECTHSCNSEYGVLYYL